MNPFLINRNTKMPYHYLEEIEFNLKYQALVNYRERYKDISNALANLHNEPTLKDLFVLNGEAKSFLHIAAAEGNLAVITFLKETGHEINRQDFNKKTPLTDACKQLKIGSVNALLANGADPNLGDSHITFTAMHDGEQVSYLGENVPLVAAIESAATVTAEEFREFAVTSISHEDLSRLTDNELATERVRAIIVKNLIAHGASILLQTGVDNSSAFHRAILLKKLLVINEIADVGGPEIFNQRNRDGEAALNLAVSYWEKDEKEDPKVQVEMEIEEEITDMIIEHAEAKLPSLLAIEELKFGNTAIHTAVICSNYKVLKKILIKGYKFDSLKNLSRQNYKGNTPIHEAINEAWRGPKILGLLMSIAMPDDLVIVNYGDLSANRPCETAEQMAERLFQEANSVKTLVEKVEKATTDLEQFIDESNEIIELDEIDVPAEIGLLLKAMRDLSNSDPLDDKLSSENGEQALALSLEIDNFIIELEKYDVEGLVEKAREQIEKYERDASWSIQDAKELVTMATMLGIGNLHIPKEQDVNQANLLENDANKLAASARKLFERYDQGERLLNFSLDKADELVSSARTLIAPIKRLEFFQKSYLDSLNNIKQEKFLAWQAQQEQLPRSFPDLKIVDTNLLNRPNPAEQTYTHPEWWYNDGVTKYNDRNYLGAIQSLEKSVRLFKLNNYNQHFSLAQAHFQLAYAYLNANNDLNVQTNAIQIENNNINAQINLEKAIDIYFSLEQYKWLESAFQVLAKTYIISEFNVANYEQQNRNKLSLFSDSSEELHGHLALAGLYKELREQNFASSSFSVDDLSIRESYHYHQAYKLTQGKLDNSAHVVLQREIGIANNANLGTYNIQQCIAVVAFEPQSKKVVLSHFDKFSGPASFIEQLANQFPDQAPIHLYISGGRDRQSPAKTTIPSFISDNNKELVLKQIYRANIETSLDGNPENGRYKIKACDVGDRPSPQGIVFDVQSQRLLHATPNFADNSIESRAVNFMLQRANEDYIRPLNPVDFTQSEAERTIIFSPEDQDRIRSQLRDSTIYYANYPQSKAWEHDQVFYPLKMVNNKIAAVTPTDFTTGVLTEYRTQFINSLYGNSLLSNTLQVALRSNTLDLEESLNALQVADPNNFLDDEDMSQVLRCLGNRRRRDAGLCTLDSEYLLEGLKELSESKQAEILDHIATRKVAGVKQEEIATLVRNYKWLQHVQKVSDISSKTMEIFFAGDAAIDFFEGDKSKTAIYVNLKALEVISKRASRGAGVALNMFNAYEDFSNLLKHSNNTAAWLRFANSGMQTVVDLGSSGLKAAEGVSETFAALEVSAAFEAIGGTVVTVLILADRFYEAGTAVEDEEDLLRKNFSFGTKITEFVRAVFGRFSEYQEKIDDIAEYQNLIPQLQEFLKNHTEVRHFVFPAIVKTGEKYSCRRTRMLQRHCKSIYTPIFDLFKDQRVNFSAKQSGFKLNNEVQNALPSGEFACLPTGNDISLAIEGAYRCDGAFALNNVNGSIAYFNLMEGNDRVIGFKNLSNIFIINDGSKAYQGGDLEDQFVLVGKHIVTAIQPNTEIEGINGGKGLDTLLLQQFKPEVDYIELNLAGYMKYADSELRVRSIERVVGGAIPLGVTVACDTKEIDTAATGVAKSPDSIFIPSNPSCDYDLKMDLRPYMSVTNEAERGHFVYTVTPGQGNVLVNLAANTQALAASSIHQIEFNATLAEVSAISFPAHLSEGSARALQIQINKSLPDQSTENFIFVLHTQQFETVFIRFIDQGRLKIGHKNSYYVRLGLNQFPSEIIDYYAPLMRRLNLVGFFVTGTNEHILIGHNKHAVMQNNPNVFRTHLCGNGGEGIFKIKSGMSNLRLSNLPIPQVDIYDIGDGNINILDFSSVAQQVEAQMNRTVQLFLVTPNAQNNLGDDLLLVLGIPSSKPHQITPIATVNIPKAFHHSQHHWFKKRLHIILGDKNKLLQIDGRHKHLFLKPVPRVSPVPLVLDKKLEIVRVNVSKIETNSTVFIPQAYTAGAFFQQNKTSLIWTNIFTNTISANYTAPFTLIIDKFFQELMETLSLQFTDKRLALTNSSAEINRLASFEEAKNACLGSKRQESLAIINSKQLASHSTQPTNVSAIEVSSDQELYLDNDIDGSNATSIEDHTEDYSNEERNDIDFEIRQRRSIEHLNGHSTNNAGARQSGILQTMVNTFKNSLPNLFSNNAQRNSRDKALEMAADFYDKQDQKKIPVLKKVPKKSKKTVEPIQIKPIQADKTKHFAPTRKLAKNSALLNKSHKKLEPLQVSTNTAKPRSFFPDKQEQIQPRHALRNSRGNNQTFYVNQTSKNNVSGANLVKAIGNKPENFSRSLSLAQARLADNQYRHQQHNHQQHSRQQTGKSGISKVTAIGDIPGLLLLGHCMFISKPQTSLNPKIVRFHQQKERRICKQQGPQKLYIPTR